MDFLTFVDSVLRTLAWPLAALAIALVLRAPLVALLPFARLGYKGLTVDFERKIAQMEADSLQASGPGARKPATVPALREAREVALTSPTAAILLGWTALEMGLRDAVRKVGRAWPSGVLERPSAALKFLEADQYIGTLERRSLEDFRQIRNELAHGRIADVTAEEATRLIDLAEHYLALLATIGPAASRQVRAP